LIRCAEHHVRQQIVQQFVDFPQENNMELPSGNAVLQHKTAGRAMLAPTAPYAKSKFELRITQGQGA